MINLDKAISTAVKTGKISLGADSTIKNAQSGRAKMIILASNCPMKFRENIEYYCKLSKIPIVNYRGSSMDLAAVCGKPFGVSALSIREAGDSEILKLLKQNEGSEESDGGNE